MYGLSHGDESDGDQEKETNFWRLIGSIIKYFRISMEDILWMYSWANLTMLLVSIPKSKRDKEKEQRHEITDPDELEGLMR